MGYENKVFTQKMLDNTYLSHIKKGECFECEGCDFSGLTFKDFNGFSTSFKKCIFDNTTFINASKKLTIFDSSLKNAKIIDSDIQNGSFTRCNLSGLTINNSKINYVSFKNCNINEIKIDNCRIYCDFYEVKGKNCMITSSSFRKSIFENVEIEESKMQTVDLKFITTKNTSFLNTEMKDVFTNFQFKQDVKIDESESFRKFKVLEESETGFLKCRGNVIVKIEIPKGAVVYGTDGIAFYTDKCYVTKVFGADKGIDYGTYGKTFEPGKNVNSDISLNDRNSVETIGIRYFKDVKKAIDFDLYESNEPISDFESESDLECEERLINSEEIEPESESEDEADIESEDEFENESDDYSFEEFGW